MQTLQDWDDACDDAGSIGTLTVTFNTQNVQLKSSITAEDKWHDTS